MSASVMKTIRCHSFGGIDVLKVESIAKPTVTTPNQVLVRVYAAGINPVDTYIRQGAYSNLPELPYTPGKDCAGVVEQCGDDVTHVKSGDRVYTTCQSSLGAYAEYALCHSHEVYPLHPSLTFLQGASIGVPYYTAYRALISKGRGKSGDVVLVHGASGGVGCAVVQLAAAQGLQVLGTAGSKEGMEVVTKCGAKQVFNHRSNEYIDEIKSSTVDTEGVNIIIEMLANKNLNTDLTLLARGGTVVCVGGRGACRGFTPGNMLGKEVSVRGVAVLRSSQDEMRETSEMLWKGQESGWLRPVVDKAYPLEDAAQAHQYIMNNEAGARGKVCLQIRAESE